MNITLDHREKMEIFSMIRTWSRMQVTQDRLREIQRITGIPARSVEVMFWHYDTLSLLENEDWMVFKGGTSVQSYLPSSYQRASVDLDFNSSIENPNSIRLEVERINKSIRDLNASKEVQGVRFGELEFQLEDTHSGTLNFTRRIPSRFNEMITVGADRIQGREMRIQINYKNAWLPALRKIHREPHFMILDHEVPGNRVNITHSSREDLISDKILATCNVHGFGRERFKDIYDLVMLFKLDFDASVIIEKLDRVAKRKKASPDEFIKGSIETISEMSQRSVDARGFGAMVAGGGRELMSDWESFCYSAIVALRSLID